MSPPCVHTCPAQATVRLVSNNDAPEAFDGADGLFDKADGELNVSGVVAHALEDQGTDTLVGAGQSATGFLHIRRVHPANIFLQKKR